MTHRRWTLLTLTWGLLLTTASSADDDQDSDEDRCPCSLAADQIKIRGKAIGTGPSAMVSVTGYTWNQSSTVMDLTGHKFKTELELILSVLPKVTATYDLTLGHQTNTVRTNIKHQPLVEFTDFTEDESPGRCYSYAEDPICEDSTERNCTASLSCKAKFLRGRGNATMLEVSSYSSPTPSLSTGNLGALERIWRFATPTEPPKPISLSHDLACGDTAYAYVTTGQWSLNMQTKKVKLHADFGYSAACGACPKKYDSDKE